MSVNKVDCIKQKTVEFKQVINSKMKDIIIQLESSVPIDLLEKNPDDSKKAYTYELTNEETLKDQIKEAQQYIDKMCENDKEKYNNFINNVKYNKDGTVDINDANTLKTFLALKKVIKYEGNVRQSERAGIHNEESPFLGAYCSEYNRFNTTVNSHPVLQNSMNNFYKGIYDSNVTFNMLSEDDVKKSKPLAQKMLNDELSKYNAQKFSFAEETTDDEIPSGLSNKTHTNDVDNEWNDWCLKVSVDKDGTLSSGKKGSVEVITLHELYHVKQSKPGEKEDYSDKLVELGATIDLIVRNDELYKYANSIDINKCVDYENKIVHNGKEINVGIIANTFRDITNKYNLETYEEAMLTEEGKKFILENFN